MKAYKVKTTGTDGSIHHTHVGLQPINGNEVIHIFRKVLVKPKGNVKSWRDSGYKTVKKYNGYTLMFSLIGIKLDTFSTITQIVCKLLEEKTE